MYQAILSQVFCDFHTVFCASHKSERTRYILYFSRTNSYFQGRFYKFQEKRHFFQIPGVFQDQGQIQGLFQVCANPAIAEFNVKSEQLKYFKNSYACQRYGWLSGGKTESSTTRNKWALIRENLFSGFETNKGADQPGHPHRLISAFVNQFLESIISKLASREISIF